MPEPDRTVTLNDGRAMPRLGFGVYQVEEARAPEIVGVAIRAGYRSIDTAAIYGNEAGIGRAIRDAEVARADLFVTTKLWNDHHGYDAAQAGLDESLDRLGLDHVDLYLIHWPCPGQGRFVETWKGLIALRESGKVRSIGVSNFTPALLDRIVGETGIVPAVNQIELHPRFQQEALRAAHTRHGIVTESWSPLGRGHGLADPILAAIAKAHGRTPAQIVLRWHLQNGLVAIPKTATPARIAENIAVFDFALSDDEMARIATLDRPDGRTGPDPDRFG
ncbi:aldo/keto reductase [Methylobacterium dankookense]|uniref:Oxidoreductase/MSMEI_2347 n=1 Tax=Methylobacterium dankookense TaxID=560405 RepID=A0A564FWK0_9HYPH|nr:aldo/keto reductase [Methylobacterium dankookense]GJD58300.1 putative oxidoreductase/MSMEI_2347 [Methylobacterium dankookense]VUF12493.1 putative oxidoreductase/MSMEI_2347 [Methylobacterium dankookense]